MKITSLLYGRGTPGPRRALALTVGWLLSVSTFGFGASPEGNAPPTKSAFLRIASTVKKGPAGVDPLLVLLRSRRMRVGVGDEVELTVTVRHINLSPAVRYVAEGANGYALRLLLPEGFEATENPLSDFVRGSLSPAQPEATYTVRGRFAWHPAEATFRLLRGPHDADEKSLFAEKARLRLEVTAPDRTVAAARTAGSAPTRQLIYNSNDGNQAPVRFAKNHYCTAVSFWEAWYRYNPAPGVYKWDSLQVALNLCRQLGLKAQVNFALRRQANTSGKPQDYAQFFPESDLMRYNDGSVYQYQPVADKYDVLPSLSSAQGMAAIETFLKAAASFLKPYYDDGTLLNVLAVTGQQGELNYPVDETQGKLRWTDYGQPTLSEYRGTYLPNRYGTVAALNQAWGTNLASFADVPYPVGPTASDQYPSMNSEANRDWIRFGMKKMKDLTSRCRAALQSVAPIPFSYFSSEMSYYWYSVPFRATNIAYMAGGLDGLYTSAGTFQGDLEGTKLGWLDVIKGTLGSDKIMEIEFDNNDISSTPDAFDQAGVIKTLGARFFEKGGEFIHMTPLGSFNWGAVDPYLKYLRDTYCTAPNNAVTPRAPVASASYSWSSILAGKDNAPFDAWRSVNGPSQQVDIRCVDDFNIDQTTPAPSPGGATSPPVVACTRPAALVADSPATLGSDLQLTASFDGGTGEANVTYQWTRPDGSVVNAQTYAFGDPTKAPAGAYTFKAVRNSDAACLTVTISAEGVTISQ
jgi:hypothetical protein